MSHHVWRERSDSNSLGWKQEECATCGYRRIKSQMSSSWAYQRPNFFAKSGRKRWLPKDVAFSYDSFIDTCLEWKMRKALK